MLTDTSNLAGLNLPIRYHRTGCPRSRTIIGRVRKVSHSRVRFRVAEDAAPFYRTAKQIGFVAEDFSRYRSHVASHGSRAGQGWPGASRGSLWRIVDSFKNILRAVELEKCRPWGGELRAGPSRWWST